MRPISGLIIHCTATAPNWWHDKATSAKVAEVARWHTLPPPHGRGWRKIGYHYLIDRDGTVAKGRPVEETGAHVQGHNTGTIGISLFGGDGSKPTDQFSDHFTQAQDASLRALIADLHRRFGTVPVTGHNDYTDAKACPGFDAKAWFAVRPRTTNPVVAHKPAETAPQGPPAPQNAPVAPAAVPGAREPAPTLGGRWAWLRALAAIFRRRP